ncbi:MAG: hypothetical protein EZS28_008185 [Streblomastix strix]|uniref:Uncharacterized protein n=1 Tax=Streblomastix strix TaxID=222440 RepID=A0A5J4WNT5_9EUKA|nr:MAG: hypothetical protein EZS28_008185 [Streblomastix strix]
MKIHAKTRQKTINKGVHVHRESELDRKSWRIMKHKQIHQKKHLRNLKALKTPTKQRNRELSVWAQTEPWYRK